MTTEQMEEAIAMAKRDLERLGPAGSGAHKEAEQLRVMPAPIVNKILDAKGSGMALPQREERLAAATVNLRRTSNNYAHYYKRHQEAEIRLYQYLAEYAKAYEEYNAALKAVKESEI